MADEGNLQGGGIRGSRPGPGSVFISYSHEDEVWKNRLVKHLGVLGEQDLLRTWNDRNLRAGDLWLEGIQSEIDGARVAVLLVSANSLTSKFILHKEVPRFLELWKQEGMTIFPVIVKDCAWQKIPWLAQFQIRPLDGKPLAMRGIRIDSELRAIAEEILEIIAGGAPVIQVTPILEEEPEEKVLLLRPSTGFPPRPPTSPAAPSPSTPIVTQERLGIDRLGPTPDLTPPLEPEPPNPESLSQKVWPHRLRWAGSLLGGVAGISMGIGMQEQPGNVIGFAVFTAVLGGTLGFAVGTHPLALLIGAGLGIAIEKLIVCRFLVLPYYKDPEGCVVFMVLMSVAGLSIAYVLAESRRFRSRIAKLVPMIVRWKKGDLGSVEPSE